MNLTPQALSRALAALGVDPASASSSGWVQAPCPACPAGSSPSLRVQVSTGGYRCHRCNASSSGGVPLDAFLDNPRAPGLSAPGDRHRPPPLDAATVARHHEILMDSPGVLQDLQRVRGWTRATVEKLGLGWDGSHLLIPVYSPSGELVNARMYDPFKRSRTKSFHYANPDGLRRTTVWLPFGQKMLEETGAVWWFEGEPDAVLAAQMGFPTAVVTGGAGTWCDEVVPVATGRKNVLCYDTDSAGMNGARRVAARMRSLGMEVVAVQMPLSSGLKDFTDAVQKDSRDSKWFRALAADAWAGRAPAGTGESQEPVRVRLGGGVPGEPIRTMGHVFGTHMVPALVPASVEATCAANWNPERCNVCPVQRANLQLRVDVAPDSRDLMALVVANAKQQEAEVRRIGGIPARCPTVRLTTSGMWQVQQLKLSPPLADRDGGDSTLRSALFVSPADGRPLPVQTNRLYDFVGKVEPDVLTNEWTLLSCDASPAEDDAEAFSMDPDLRDRLAAAFQPDAWTPEGIARSVEGEARRLARHVTKIFGREDLLVAVDLCYHSVLQFPFVDRVLTRGWLSLGVFGDTRTGKSETIHAMAEHLAAGKYVADPSNATYAGLVGGLQQVGSGDKSWSVTWGLIPMNDKGLVAVDEASSLSTDDIGRMSGMRSSGVADITKIRGASTQARTRLIMSGNPRGTGRSLRSYPTPVEGFMELIGAPEDVARFDLVVGVLSGLDKGVADAALGQQDPPADVELRRALLRFAWSRRAEHVTWSPGAEALCSALGAKMARSYHASIPIVEPSEQDARIARLAVAAAARTFSVDPEDPLRLVVRSCHVEYAAALMERAYCGDLGYRDYSDFLTRQRLDEDLAMDAVGSVSPDRRAACRALLGVRAVSPSSIGMVLALDGGEARQLIARLVQCGAARFETGDTRGQSVVWTPEFIQLLRRLEVEKPPEVDLGKEPF